MMIVAVGSGEQIARLVPELGGLPRRPLLALERVRVCRRDGHFLSPPSPLPATDEQGLAVWQKLMVCASSKRATAVARFVWRLGAGCGGPSQRGDVPAGHLGLPRRPPAARRSPAAASPPRPGRDDHRRHARAVPDSFAIVDELTGEARLVTSEMLPALGSLAEGRRQRGGLRLSRHRFQSGELRGFL